MSGQKSFFSTLPGILTALAGLVTAAAGLIYALSETGLLGSRGKDETQPVVSAPKQAKTVAPKEPGAVPPKQPAAIAPGTPQEQTPDGWAIIGSYERGIFSDPKLRIPGDSPAIGRSYDAVADFRLIQKRPERGQATITLGMVRRGDRVEVLDVEIAPATGKVPVLGRASRSASFPR